MDRQLSRQGAHDVGRSKTLGHVFLGDESKNLLVRIDEVVQRPVVGREKKPFQVGIETRDRGRTLDLRESLRNGLPNTGALASKLRNEREKHFRVHLEL